MVLHGVLGDAGLLRLLCGSGLFLWELHTGLGLYHTGLGVRGGLTVFGLFFFLFAVFRKDLFQFFVLGRTVVVHESCLLIGSP